VTVVEPLDRTDRVERGRSIPRENPGHQVRQPIRQPVQLTPAGRNWTVQGTTFDHNLKIQMANDNEEWRVHTGLKDENLVKAMQRSLPVSFRKERQMGDPVFDKMPWPTYKQFLARYMIPHLIPENQEEHDIILINTLPLVEAMRDIEEWFGWQTMKVIMKDLTAAAVTEEVEESKEEMESEKGETEVQERETAGRGTIRKGGIMRAEAGSRPPGLVGRKRPSPGIPVLAQTRSRPS
jgi:hypothetical protein